MKGRRHHNNKGTRKIQRGKVARQVEDMARRILGRGDYAPSSLRRFLRSSNQDG